MIAGKVSVELGQLLALGVILTVMPYWRSTTSFVLHAVSANFVLMTAGFVLAGYQLSGFLTKEEF